MQKQAAENITPTSLRDQLLLFDTESALASPGWAEQTPLAPTQAACLESGA